MLPVRNEQGEVSEIVHALSTSGARHRAHVLHATQALDQSPGGQELLQEPPQVPGLTTTACWYSAQEASESVQTYGKLMGKKRLNSKKTV